MSDPLPPIDWTLVRDRFDEALRRPPSEREAWVRSLGDDARVTEEVLSLLAHASGGSADPRDFLQGGAAAAAGLTGPGPAGPAVAGQAPEGRAGQRLGPWEIVAPLGQGGMGEVWRARRADGRYEGEAAIKLLKRGMDSQAVLRRFALEQQALARLDHPHIARLLDAGLSDTGLPYFVMERVDGRPIDQACDGLPLEGRLALFLQLADAVSHAHRHLLVHRDLKPGNVLVTRDGRVKLLDFGIAKALDPLEPAPGTPADDAAGLTTQQGQRPFTPLYASPEQVRGEPVSTATDLYSLGVLLYQLLTGQRPYGRGATSPLEAARAVLEETPTRPSQLSPRDTDDRGWLATRQRLRGDLDNILLKALEKPVERRYASVDAMAADLRAYLDGRPVSARAPSPLYVMGKFIGRHRVGSALAAGALAAVLGSAGVAAWQAHAARLARADTERQLAQLKAVSQDLVFRFADGVQHMPRGAELHRLILTRTAERLDEALRDRPDDLALVVLSATAHARVVDVMTNDVAGAQGSDPAAAQRLLARSIERSDALARQAESAGHADWLLQYWMARARVGQAKGLRSAGDAPGARALLERQIAALDAALARETDDFARLHLLAQRGGTWLVLAQVFDEAHRTSLLLAEPAMNAFDRVDADLRDALALPEAVFTRVDAVSVPGEASARTGIRHMRGVAKGGRAQVALRADALEDARRFASEGVALHQANVADEPDSVAWRDGLMTEANSLSLALIRLGDGPAALQAARLAWDTAEALARSEGPQSKWAQSLPILTLQLGRAQELAGDPVTALATHERGLAHWRTVLAGSDNPGARRRFGVQLLQAARAQITLGRTAAARERLAEADAVITPLVDLPALRAFHRDLRLARAELRVLRAGLPGPVAERRADLSQALAWLDAAQTERPLAPDHRAVAQRAQALQAALPS
jgi:hypothetical protein